MNTQMISHATSVLGNPKVANGTVVRALDVLRRRHRQSSECCSCSLDPRSGSEWWGGAARGGRRAQRFPLAMAWEGYEVSCWNDRICEANAVRIWVWDMRDLVEEHRGGAAVWGFSMENAGRWNCEKFKMRRLGNFRLVGEGVGRNIVVTRVH